MRRGVATVVGVKVPIRQLRADVAAAVRRAGAGERIVVTVAGRPVAQLGPLDDVTGHTSLDDLVARGLLLAPRRTGDYHPGEVVPTWRGARLDRLLREIRG
jgi:prevent-host-death family protein